MSWEHDVETDKLVDAVLIALYDWTIEQKAWRLEFVSGRMLRAEELQGVPAEALPLAAYMLRFRVGRSVARKQYDGSVTYETGEIGSVEITTEVSLTDDDYEEVD